MLPQGLVQVGADVCAIAPAKPLSSVGGTVLAIVSLCTMFVGPRCHFPTKILEPTKWRSEMVPWGFMAGSMMVMPSGKEFRSPKAQFHGMVNQVLCLVP